MPHPSAPLVGIAEDAFDYSEDNAKTSSDSDEYSSESSSDSYSDSESTEESESSSDGEVTEESESTSDSESSSETESTDEYVLSSQGTRTRSNSQFSHPSQNESRKLSTESGASAMSHSRHILFIQMEYYKNGTLADLIQSGTVAVVVLPHR